MVFKYCVKHNGVIYPPGADVPVEDKPEPKTVEEVPVKTVKSAEEKSVKPVKSGTRRTKK